MCSAYFIFVHQKNKIMKIGVLAEEKVLDDKRVPLTPNQCKMLLDTYPSLEISVKSSAIRYFSDEMYIANGIDIVDDLSDCDVLIGVNILREG